MPNDAGMPQSVGNQVALVCSKVPAATFGFWVLKLIATTVGEIGGNLLSMNLGLGYLTATLLLFAVFGSFTALQIRARKFHPALLGNDCRLDHGWDHPCRFCRQVPWHRLHRRVAAPFCFGAGIADGLEVGRRHAFVRRDRWAPDRAALLDDNHLFADARHCAWRLVRSHCWPRLWRFNDRFQCRARAHRRALFL